MATTAGRPGDGPAGEGRFRWVAAVAAAAAVVRLLHAFALNGSPLDDVLVGDARSYDAWARRLAGGDWLGSGVFYQAPLYPYFLGVVYALLGATTAAARVVQALLGAAGCGFLALAGRSWFGARAGLVAGALAAVYAPGVFFDALIQKSALDFVLASALLWVLGRAYETGTRLRTAAASGAVLGAFCLTRENALLLVPWIALWFLLGSGGARHRIAAVRTAAFAAGLLAALIPVGIRNAVAGGEFVLTTMQSGTNLWIGNNPEATGRYVPLRAGRETPEYERVDATEIAETAAGRALGAREVSAWWRNRVLAWIREHPGDWARLMVRKTLLVWNRVELPDTESLQLHADHSVVLRVLAVVPAFGILAPLAFAGIALTRRRWRVLWPLYGIVAVFTVAVALFFVFARYRFPLVPVLLLFAGAAVVEGVDAIRSGARREIAAASASALAAALVVWAPAAPSIDPRPLDWSNLGTAYADAGRWEEAIAWYRRSAAALPSEAQVRINLGRALDAVGRTVEAEAEFRSVLARDPSSVPARTNLGVLLARKGDLPGARAEFEAALRVDPAATMAWNNLGNVERLSGRLAEAVRAYRQALAGDPGWIEARVNLGAALLEAGRRDEAVVELRAVLERDPHQAEARALLESAGVR